MAALHSSSMSSDTKDSPFLLGLIWKLFTNCFLLVARFYVMCILIVWEWTVKIVTGALKPFEPIITQVKKVPKKDISLEGIFYQFLRLQFIILLFLTPFARNAFSRLVKPLTRLHDWAVNFVDNQEKKTSVGAQD